MERNNTYTEIYIQVIFAVTNRKCLIRLSWEAELLKFITGIVQRKGQNLLAINGAGDHIHILIRLRPTCVLADLVREIKKSSNEFVNNKRFLKSYFSWQEGYGAFSYSRWDVEKIIAYVKNQKEHHEKKTFRQEYIQLLKEFEIPYEEKYLFNWIEDVKLTELVEGLPA